MSVNEFDKLHHKIKDKLDSDDVVRDGDIISADMINLAIRNGMTVYHAYFVDDMGRMVKSYNKKIGMSNLFKRKKTPYLYKICPGISDGDKYIDVYFANYDRRRAIGKITIDEHLGIKLDYFSDEYNPEKAIEFLKENVQTYEPYFRILGAFEKQYPGMSYEWNNHYNGSTEMVDDGFNTVLFDLDRPYYSSVSFSNRRDIDIARSNSKNYGKLYDYLDFFKNDFMRKIKVNVNYLNPIYQTIVRREMDLSERLAKQSEHLDKQKVKKL